MLNTTEKRNLDSAKNILVGKIPDPKAQVEQITTALIYKFMDDMDMENEDLGLESQFFVDDYKKYSWRNLLDNKLSGQERMDLYVEAISNIPKNPHIPQLFRDIFKGAFLPFRDPRTLSLFLKQINEFSYENSENLGNAFEYLLSILGSQGDAGQFRTPRHIIDFIVEVVNPQKNETILDPACGTAGFLISSYKHIIRENSSNYKEDSYVPTFADSKNETVDTVEIQKDGMFLGDNLTPEEKQKLTENIAGYDISPDMVKLALVNLYLHKFSDPKIFEYDTLTSDKRWDDTFDVILANPPFMTPKGGISPHKRFSIDANRAEVLFVDYIAEHLSINGRAGIVVPEGIVFQSANAYKNLRKNLVENWGLYAVVSLPSGVFQPYSGVKTSILFIDKELAKKTDKILFLKAENDGFDLGSNRRAIDKNDLPKCFDILEQWKNTQTLDKNETCALSVAKTQLAENDYNLTGDRYREAVDYSNVKWDMVELGEVCEVSSGNSAPQNKDFFDNGKYPFYRTSDVGVVHLSTNLSKVRDYLNDTGIQNLKQFEKGTILFPKSGASTLLNHRVIMGKDGYVSSHLATITANREKAIVKFVYYLLTRIDAKNITQNQDYPSLKLSEIKQIKIPLPPLEIQEKIVAEIEQYQKVIDGAKQVVENYKPSFSIAPDWKMVELGEVCEVNKENVEIDDNIYYHYIDISSVENKTGKITFKDIIKGENLPSRAKRKVKINDILLSTVRPNLKAFAKISELPENPIVSTGFATLTPKKRVKSGWVFQMLFTNIIQEQIKNQMGKGAYPSINQNDVKKIKIPLPSTEIQEQIVAEIEAEQSIVNANKILIEKMQAKIDRKIAEVWGEEI
ncbi:N-6 DNA methylase [Candidatus Gracilibacteria bacterium]|nr:N-6 DNA methylase [Candidatus Gracilibacteria bacterium]